MMHPKLVLQCRPGFEIETRQETLQLLRQGGIQPKKVEQEEGIVWMSLDPGLDYIKNLHWKSWTFARQWWLGFEYAPNLDSKSLSEQIMSLIKPYACHSIDLSLEYPDTNDGKSWHPKLEAMRPLVEKILEKQGIQLDDWADHTVHALYTDQRTFVGMSHGRSAPWRMGIPRLRMPSEAPSRSTLKLAEAFETLLSESEREQWIKAGMTAVDLGAAPGGWSWQLLSRGMRVTAVDNGPMKGVVATHPMLTHLKQDGFRFQPDRPVDWLVCDMVEKPSRVAELMADWFCKGWTKAAIFNLKFPMRKRYEEVQSCLKLLLDKTSAQGVGLRVQAKHLYHDREEVTVCARREGKAKPKGAW